MNLVGKMLNNRYEILEKIGNGGMATVYRAKCHVLNRFVAIKVLKDEFTTDTEFIKRFNSEAQSAASLTHPNIVSIYDVGSQDNLYYIVMELIQGKTLKEIITEDGCLSWKWSINIAMQIASALETAHKNNIIHRDIKPHNIIITEDGVAKVTDFGIAKAVSNSTITAFGTTIGSVHYFSPEHARGGYTDAKSDIYSLGIVMYEMLTERVPFDADTPVSVALKQVQEEPVEPIKYNPKIPISVNKIILKAMQKDPNLRYQNATEMLIDLSKALKTPDEDFVTIIKRTMDSPTQKIPTIHELEAEKIVDRRNLKEENRTEKKKPSKIKEFYKKKKWAWPVTIIVGLMLLFLIAMFGTIAIVNNSRPAQAIMPNLAGYNNEANVSKEEAIATLNSLGFKSVNVTEEYSDTIEEGYVISQSPVYKANFKINTTEEVKLVVSKGQKLITLPSKIVGNKIEDVTEQLDKLGAKYTIIEENSETVEAGIVIAIDVNEGSEVPATQEIKLTASLGSAYKEFAMINVLGYPEDDAVKQLKDLNLLVEVTYTENDSKTDGAVISQSKAAGKTIKEGETVQLTVNKRPVKHSATVKINLQKITGYTGPKETKEEKLNTETNEMETITIKEDVEKAKVEVVIGSQVYGGDQYEKTNTNVVITSLPMSGVNDIYLRIDGITYSKQSETFDASKGDQTFNFPE